MRLLRKTVQHRRPILDAIVRDAHQADVRSRTQQTLLQVLANPVVDGQRHNQRSYTRRHPRNRDARDNADKGLAPLGTQVSASDKEFKAHEWLFSRQLSAT